MSVEIADETLNYVLAFTLEHEGNTPFMYNNWPWKNSVVDVTAGVGVSVVGETHAASLEIRAMFRRRIDDQLPSEDEMRQEYRRVAQTARTPSNLWAAYRDNSPLYIPQDVMLDVLRRKMLTFWDQKGLELSNLSSVPAQAQAALMSFNYGLRLKQAPHMCAAVRDADYVTASQESRIAGWDGQKNEAHRVLFLNADAIIRLGLSLSTLPPMEGPFKPPPSINEDFAIVGTWAVSIGGWNGRFTFDADGTVSWSDDAEAHLGNWGINGDRAEWWFNDPDDIRTFTVPLPIDPVAANGTILPDGQGFFTMSMISN